MVTHANKKFVARRVVVVEDNEDTRELLAELLQMWGHEVITVADGERGAERIIDTVPDVALIDVGLPDIDGFQVAKRVRVALGSRVMLVAVSGYGTEDMKKRAVASGFDSHLTKPPELTALEDLLANAPHRTRS